MERAESELEALARAGNVAREESESAVLWRAVDLSTGSSATQSHLPTDPTNPYAPSRAGAKSRVHEDDGNFWLGLFAGFFGGLLVVALFAALARPATRRGTHWGFGAQLALLSLTLLFR
jgi:hypothetical protein